MTNKLKTPAQIAAEAELAAAQKQLGWELAKAAADAAGIIDPTPISDGVSAAMSLAEGDLVGAGLSLISMVPYVGDAIGKAAKGTRAAKKLAKLKKQVAALTGRVEMLNSAAKLATKGADKAKALANTATKAVDIGMKRLNRRARAILECPYKQQMIEAAAKHSGVNRSTVARLMEIAEKDKVVIRMRPTNKDALAWINKGHPPKPEMLKMKTVNKIDELIGGPKNSRGLVGYFKPVHPDKIMPELKNTNNKLYQDALKRYKERKKEFSDYRMEMKKLGTKGEVRIENGVVVQPKSGKAFTGDNDVFDIRNADGTPMDSKKRARIIAKLKRPPVSAQHPDHMSWNRHGDAKKDEIYTNIIKGHMPKSKGGEGKALAQFGPNGYSSSYASSADLPKIKGE